MATGFPRRDFIGINRYEGETQNAQQKIRDANIISRHAAADAVKASTGMSAPFSARDSSPSAVNARAAIDARNSGAATPTADQRWASMFPRNPDGTQRISAYGGTNAAGSTSAGGPAQTSPPPTMTPSSPVQATPGAPNVPIMSNDARYAAREALYASRPDVFTAGTPANLAFIAHAQQHGEQSAHENADSYLPPAPIAGHAVSQSTGDAGKVVRQVTGLPGGSNASVTFVPGQNTDQSLQARRKPSVGQIDPYS